MLKLEPISLVLREDMASLPDSFCERIKSNYELMAASFTPKDLLFLLTNPPEMPLIDGGVTSITAASSIQNTQNFIIDIVNNIANRVLLEDKSELVYQDRVYIEMALQKLGIENVALFMKQVRTLYQENLGVYRLNELYRDNLETLSERLERISAEAGKRELPAQDMGSAEGGERRLFIHDEIYSRLGTADIYNKIFRIAQSFSERNTEVSTHEMRVAEQFRSAGILNLNDYRSRIFLTDGPELTYYRNHYELGDILPPPSTEENVVSQVVAASLLQLIDNVMVSRIGDYISNQNTWLDIRNAVQQSAANSVSRFISFHEDRQTALYESIYDIALLTTLYQTEAAAVSSYMDTVRILEHRGAGKLEQITEPYRRNEKAELRLSSVSLKFLRELTTVHEAQKTILMAGENITRSRELEYRELLSETLSQLTMQPLTEINLRSNVSQDILSSELYSEDTTLVTRMGDTYEQQDASTTRVHETESAEYEKLLRESLKEIDKQNRERVERVMELQSKLPEPPALKIPDRKKLMREALRAIENPEEAIAAAAQEEIPEPGLPPQVEALLSQTDETTRQVFEAIQLLQRDPEAAEKAGIKVAQEPSALIADIAEIEKQRLEHVREVRRELIEKEATADGAGAIYDRLDSGAAYKTESVKPPEAWNAAVPIVHRTTATVDYEELMKTQGSHKTERTEQTETHEVFNETHTAQAQVNQVTQDIVSKTTEDVTELINKTLMRQIGTISDRVYTQLEKRLQGERSRRGRF